MDATRAPWLEALHEMTRRQLIDELVPNGFELIEEYDELPWQQVMVFRPA